jgi:DNA-binding NtrC family response regulator
VPLRVPPLRERKQDIPALVTHFLHQSATANDRSGKSISTGALALLEQYDYPGNVRELRNLVERLVILTPSDDIRESDARALLPIADGGRAAGSYFRPDATLREMIEEAERDLVIRALEHHDGHITNTAAGLGLERSHLYKKMKSLDIKR